MSQHPLSQHTAFMLQALLTGDLVSHIQPPIEDEVRCLCFVHCLGVQNKCHISVDKHETRTSIVKMLMCLSKKLETAFVRFVCIS